MHGAARHLVSLGGKRLRLLCVALAAQRGERLHPAAKDLAVAAESCTRRRPPRRRRRPRERRPRRAHLRSFGDHRAERHTGLIEASAFQRGRLTPSTRRCCGVVIQAEAPVRVFAERAWPRARISPGRGQTGAFRWSLAGATAGGLASRRARRSRASQTLGVAFQVIDDVLDVAGEAALTGKPLFADLREGKVTHPVLIAVERDPAFARWVTDAVAGEPRELDEASAARVGAALKHTGAIDASRSLASQKVDEALACSRPCPRGGRGRRSRASPT
ncbi:MAG: polyprenyl synthetase family protein [Polyangiales bacterium]